MKLKRVLGASLIAVVPLLGGARGCGAVSSESPAPDVGGTWAVAYEPSLDVEVSIGGSIYDETIPAEGGMVTVNHAGTTINFAIDCTRPEVICPHEGWPDTVTAEMRNPRYPHRMWVRIPTQDCSGSLVQPAMSECGEGTSNPDCDPVCDGTLTVVERDTFGVIAEDGSSFDLFLGAGVATNGINCAMLGVSVARADFVNTGSAETMDWRVESMQNGEVVVGYTGGCLWAGDPDMDGTIEALVVGASLKLTTGFTATRAP